MPTNVVMPQMGESIAEGTIVRWIKQVGDRIDLDEPLFEISTDKVDAEIPAPAAGVLIAIRVDVGETVPVDSVVAVIGDAAELDAAAADGASASAAPVDPAGDQSGPPQPPAGRPAPAAAEPATDRPRRRTSPLVRRIASEHGIDLDSVTGTGLGGRVTKQDIMAVVEGGAKPAVARVSEKTAPVRIDGAVEVVKMSPMRRLIAEHMVASRRTSAHVHSVFDVDFSRVASLRATKQNEYVQAGAKLTYLAFIARAAIESLRAVPVINASIDGDSIVYRKDINLGIAVALDHGLIVPVIERADEKNLLGLSRAIADVAERARTKRLRPDEVLGGTFTITNPGSFGAAFGMPIINQPQVAILGVGAIEKRPVVINDAIAIRLRAYLTLGYDHRLIDGAVADQFMSRIKHRLEHFDDGSL